MYFHYHLAIFVVLVPSVITDIACPYCDLRFETEAKLDRHIGKIHSLLPWYASEDEEDAAPPPLSSSPVIGGDCMLGEEDSVDSEILDAMLTENNYTYEQSTSGILNNKMTTGDEQWCNPGKYNGSFFLRVLLQHTT